jgi:Domain of Unknown Function (DUF1080)
MPNQAWSLHSAKLFLACAAALTASVSCPAQQPTTSPKSPADSEKGRKWTSLFDGKSLTGWKESDFFGKGKVSVENGTIVLHTGMDMTGVHLERKFPKVNYEVELEAMRVDGSDFFCGLTFPVKDEFCSLIVGGWGGGVVGLSSINGFDASENETTGYREFEKGKWYPVRLRVTDQRITAWIDRKEELDVDIRDKHLDTRIEVEWSKPLGIATWQTKAALQRLRFRELPPEEVKAVNAMLPEE